MQKLNGFPLTFPAWVIVAALLILLLTAVSAADGESDSSATTVADADANERGLDPRDLPPRDAEHRSLRNNPQGDVKPSAEPQPFAGYPEAPEFSVVPRHDELTFFPCEDCHGAMPANPQPRELYSPHPGLLDHGGGRMWCLDCHDAEDRNTLRTIANENVDFNNAYLVCGQCHYQPQKDWYFGAHGKRVANWQGERELYNCTHCHNPHSPAVRPRTPEPPPPIRLGLEPMPAHHLSGAAISEESNHEK